MPALFSKLTSPNPWECILWMNEFQWIPSHQPISQTKVKKHKNSFNFCWCSIFPLHWSKCIERQWYCVWWLGQIFLIEFQYVVEVYIGVVGNSASSSRARESLKLYKLYKSYPSVDRLYTWIALNGWMVIVVENVMLCALGMGLDYYFHSHSQY